MHMHICYYRVTNIQIANLFKVVPHLSQHQLLIVIAASRLIVDNNEQCSDEYEFMLVFSSDTHTHPLSACFFSGLFLWHLRSSYYVTHPCLTLTLISHSL